MCSKFYLLHKHLMISGASGWFCGLSGLSREGASAMAPTSVSDMLQSLGLWYPVTVRWLVQATLSALLISVFLRQDCSLCDPGLWLRVLPWCPPHSLDQTSHVFSVSGKESHVKHLLSGMALLWRMTPPPAPRFAPPVLQPLSWCHFSLKSALFSENWFSPAQLLGNLLPKWTKISTLKLPPTPTL